MNKITYIGWEEWRLSKRQINKLRNAWVKTMIKYKKMPENYIPVWKPLIKTR